MTTPDATGAGAPHAGDPGVGDGADVARIRIESLAKAYPTPRGESLLALDDIDLEIRSGEIYGLLGRSGAGKSTLLRMINGLERPTSGRVLIDGIDVHALPSDQLRTLRHRIGMVFQQFNLWNSRTVYNNIAVPLKIAGWKDADIRERVAELIDFVGLGGKAFVRPRRLSGGQKQRVGIARAIAARPDILLADEATSALDPQTTTEIVDLLHSVNREFGITIVVVTHEMDVVARLADRVTILSEGRIVESGPVEQIFASPESPVTKGLVGSYSRTELGEAERERLRREHPGRRASMRVTDELVEQPILSSLARRHEVDFIIVQGGVSRVQEQRYGLLTLALSGADAHVDAFLGDLRAHVDVEEW